ncbi:hypothetical protein NDU88_004555 [Pleurodeles waltl]|uniref:Uncharacterized protein n=1 Tax=Pleurodeles waltl TaxID=8319 RepID=A0AAV7SJ67_PLEWA|nr:hypothetical protein NDU88_004555 [Pleurodeles waltl]
MAPRLCKTCHVAHTYSDHSPVLMKLHPPVTSSPLASWWLSPTLLMDEPFREELKQDVASFFDGNKDTVPRTGTIWAALKVNMQGVCLTKSGRILHSIHEFLGKVEQDVRKLEEGLGEPPDSMLTGRIRQYISDYQDMAEWEYLYQSKYLKARSNGKGDRLGCALAAITRKPRDAKVKLEIRDDRNTTVRNTSVIQRVFSRYYQNIYTSSMTMEVDIDSYLEHIVLGWLSDVHMEYLSADIEEDKIREAIMQLQSGKAPGSIRLPANFYKM